MPNCSNVIVNCIDFRYQSHIQEYIKELSIKGDVDVINIVGGGAKLDNYKISGKTMLDVSLELHTPKNIILTGHEDCGAGTTLEELQEKEKEYKKRYPNSNIFTKWFTN